MKASIVEMEGLLRGKCVPAKMLVNESLAEYLVRQFDALHERAEKAERERDELRNSDYLMWHAMACETGRLLRIAEEEISRRDAAAAEASDRIVDDGGGQQIGGIGVSDRLNCLWPIGTKFYTAAPPAVLPDIDGYTHGLFPHAVEQLTRFRDDALALGAQQQKVVELPNVYTWSNSEVVYLAALKQALDAAGVKWEVRK